MKTADLDIENLLNQEFNVEPFNGWGWGNFYITPPVSIHPPDLFRIKLTHLFYNKNDLLSGIGEEMSEDNIETKRWVVFSQRHIGIVSLLNKGPHFNISVLKSPPHFDEKGILLESELNKNPDNIYGYCYIYKS